MFKFPLPNVPLLHDVMSLSDWIIMIIIACFSVFTLFLFVAFVKAWSNIKSIKKALYGVDSSNFALNRFEVADKLAKHKRVVGLWREFDETLIEFRSTDGSIQYKNTLDAEHFFNTSTLARGVSDSRLSAAVPGFLTAIGVLGTFLGLQNGLEGLQLGADASTEQLREGIDVMIGGASVAFSTSVWGVMLSLIYNVIDKAFDNGKRKRISSLQCKIDDIFPRITPEELLNSIASDSKESRESLQGLAEKIGDKLQETMVKASNEISHSLETALTNIMAPAIDKMVNQSTESSSNALEALIDKFMDSFGQQGQQQREALSKSSDQMNDSLKSFSGNLDSFITKVEAANEKAELRDNNVMEQMNSAISAMVNTLKSQQEASQLADSARKQAVDSQIQTVQTGMQKLVEDSTQALSKTAENLISNVSESTKDQLGMSSALIEQSKELQNAIQTSSEKHLIAADAIKDASTSLNNASEQISNYGVRFQLANDTLSKALTDTITSSEDLTERNRGIAEELTKLHEQLTSNYKKHEDVQTALSQTVNEASNTFGELRKHQQDYAQLLRDNINDLAEQMSKLLRDFASEAQTQTSDRLGHWNDQTMQYTTAMTNAINTLSNVVDEMDGKLQ